MNKFHIELTDAEKELLGKINLTRYGSQPDRHAIYIENQKHIPALMVSLVARNAIPEHRQRYWQDPAYHSGRLKTSLKGVFERNGTRGDDIYVHPNFIPVLRYFLFGAELPAAVIDAFEQQAGPPQWFTSGDIQPLCKTARALARTHGIGKESAEEFFKLSLDIGLDVSDAHAVRDAINTLR